MIKKSFNEQKSKILLVWVEWIENCMQSGRIGSERSQGASEVS